MILHADSIRAFRVTLEEDTGIIYQYGLLCARPERHGHQMLDGLRCHAQSGRPCFGQKGILVWKTRPKFRLWLGLMSRCCMALGCVWYLIHVWVNGPRLWCHSGFLYFVCWPSRAGFYVWDYSVNLCSHYAYAFLQFEKWTWWNSCLLYVT